MELQILEQTPSYWLTLSVVIPAYNEGENLRAVIDGIIAYLPSLVVDYEVIIVNDGSTDATSDILCELAAQNSKLSIINHQVNQGKGAALRTGFMKAKMEWVLFTDADLQIDIKELPFFLEQIKANELILGYRKIRGDSLFRRVSSKGYALLIRTLLGIRLKDVNCPFKLVKKTTIESLTLMSSGFFIDTELVCIAQCRGGQIKEVAVTGYRRERGISSVRIRHVFETLRELLALKNRLLRQRC